MHVHIVAAAIFLVTSLVDWRLPAALLKTPASMQKTSASQRTPCRLVFDPGTGEKLIVITIDVSHAEEHEADREMQAASQGQAGGKNVSREGIRVAVAVVVSRILWTG